MKPGITSILKSLLTEYHLSLIEVLENIEGIPVHVTMIVNDISTPSTIDNKIEFLQQLALDPKMLQFIGDPRSINSSSYEDILIGTNGSLIRSETIDVFLSFHAYNRSLHLFLREYNLIIEKVWTNLNASDNEVDDFESSIANPKKRNIRPKLSIFPSNKRKKLGKTRHFVIRSIKNIDHFLVLINFIEESVEFTRETYQKVVETGVVKENLFHIRKMLSILDDRTRHLAILSESFVTRGKTLIARLDLYDSEVAFETEQKLEIIAFIFGLLGILLALIAIFVDLRI